jgi:hypothetical protein
VVLKFGLGWKSRYLIELDFTRCVEPGAWDSEDEVAGTREVGEVVCVENVSRVGL